MNTKTLERAVVWLACAAFLTPLVIRPETYIFPFVFPKLIWFRTIVLLMVGCYATLLVVDWKKYLPKFNWISGAVGLFALSWLVSSYVGVDVHRSVWDGHERMLGLFTFVHYLIFYFILSATVRSAQDWRTLAKVFLGIGAMVMLIAVVQHFDPFFLYNNGGTRASGTLGNPIYLGAFAYFLTCLGAWLSVSANKNHQAEKYFGYVSVLLGLVGIVFSESRGPFLGFLATILVYALVYAVATKQKWAKQAVIGLMGVVVLASSLVYVYRDSEVVRSIPIVGRLATVADAGSLATNTRVMAWAIAIDGWQDKPMFGWGPNNYLYVFNAHYRPEFLEKGGWGETWFDNAHNVILNTLAVQGIFGLTTYLLIFAAAVSILIKAYRAQKIEVHFLAFGLAFLAGHLVQNVFVFENATSYLYFFFVLAMIVALTRTDEEVTKRSSVDTGTLIAIMIGVLIIMYATNMRPAKANGGAFKMLGAVYQTLTPAKKSLVPEVLAQFEYVDKQGSPHMDDIRMDFARTIDEQMTGILRANGAAETKKMFDLAYNEIKKNRELHPLDVRYHIQQAQLALTGARLTNDVAYVYDAREAMNDALVKSPKRQQLYYIAAVSQMYLQNYDEGIRLLRESLSHNDRVAETWWRVAGLQLEKGDKEAARQTFLEAESKGIVFGGEMAGGMRVLAGLPTSTPVK